MMKKTSTIIYAILVFIMILTPAVFAEEVLSFTDDINDVLDATTGKKVSRPNIDIYKISCSKVDKVVELKLQLASTGKIQNKMTFYYTIDLTTNLNTYLAFFGGGEIGVTDENESEIDVIEYSGDGTNELKISFNLSSSEEVCLNLSAQTAEFSIEAEEGYIDQYPEEFEFIEVNAGGPYTGTEGKPIQFYGNTDYEGSNLEWIWDFGDGGTSEIRNPKHTYNESGTFEVVLEVSDSSGLIFGIDNTTVIINPGSTPNGNGESKDSGLGIIVFVVLIIVVVIVGVVAVFFIRRR